VRTARVDRPRASRRFGQHFLEPVWAARLVEAIDPAPDDVFVEIGAGTGALTQPLARRPRSVVAIEVDRRLVSLLRGAAWDHVQVLEADFLRVSAEQLRQNLPPGCTARVIGNLPYNVASPILFQLLRIRTEGLAFRDATLMLQREVADRLLAHPGTKDYGVLTILVGTRARVRRLLDLPPGAFRPVPAVHSTVVQLAFHEPDPPTAGTPEFEAMVKAVFTRRRKTLLNALRGYPPAEDLGTGAILMAAGVDGGRRPETLTAAEFGRVTEALSAGGRRSG
jgi:16S rRNA (adenine1518-N6/adenine1519-N6)-dimethyltransferase